LPYCPECGSEVRDGAKFCENCGTNLSQQDETRQGSEELSDQQQQYQQPPQREQPIQQQPQQRRETPSQQPSQPQQQQYQQPPRREEPKKPFYKKLPFIGLIVALIIGAVIGTTYFVFLVEESDEEKIIGEWEDLDRSNTYWRFKEDGELEVYFEGSWDSGEWELHEHNNTIKVEIEVSDWRDYEFSEEGDRLELLRNGTVTEVFVRVDEIPEDKEDDPTILGSIIGEYEVEDHEIKIEFVSLSTPSTAELEDIEITILHDHEEETFSGEEFDWILLDGDGRVASGSRGYIEWDEDEEDLGEPVEVHVRIDGYDEYISDEF